MNELGGRRWVMRPWLVAVFACILTAWMAAPAYAQFLGDVDAEGLRELVAQHRDKVVVVNFWATWCGPCRVELPHLEALRKEYSQDDLYLAGVSLDFDPQAPERFAREHKQGYPTYLAGPDVPSAFGVGAIPMTLIWGKDGTLEHEHLGIATLEYLRGAVEELRGKGQ